jgi:transposase, IS5 family
VIKTHRAQRSFGDGLIAEEVRDLHEAWMKHADQLLDDPQIVAAVYEALAQRHPQSRKRGRPGTPAEVVLRLLVLKHMRNWSYGCWNERCAPIWCTAISPASAPPRCPTPKP